MRSLPSDQSSEQRAFLRDGGAPRARPPCAGLLERAERAVVAKRPATGWRRQRSELDGPRPSFEEGGQVGLGRAPELEPALVAVLHGLTKYHGVTTPRTKELVTLNHPSASGTRSQA